VCEVGIIPKDTAGRSASAVDDRLGWWLDAFAISDPRKGMT
jgi:hypothetical protein